MNTSRLVCLSLLCALGLFSGCMSNAQWKKIPTIELEGWKHTDNLGLWQSSIAVDKVARNPDGTFTALNYEGKASFMGYGVHDEIKALKITPPASAKAKAAATVPTEKP